MNERRLGRRGTRIYDQRMVGPCRRNFCRFEFWPLLDKEND